MSPARKLAKLPKPVAWNQVKALFESLEKSIRTVAEEARGLRSEFSSFKMALEDVDKRVQRLEPILNTLAPVPNKLNEIADKIGRIEKRLELAEAKLPA